MKGWIYILLCLLPVSLATLRAQEAPLLESLLENAEPETPEADGFLELIEDLQRHPLAVNSATAGELLQIPFLSGEIAREIVAYRKRRGHLNSVADLDSVPGISRELAEALAPLLRFQPKATQARIEYRIRTARALHTPAGYHSSDPERRYHNPLYLHHRLRLHLRSGWEAGALWEKDAGEADWFDFGSAYLSAAWPHAHTELILGDYHLEAGQGLLLSSPYGSARSLEGDLTFSRQPFRWRVNRSSDENAFLRGLMGHFRPLRQLDLNLAYSRHALDATLTEDSLTVRSFYQTGYHRTGSEIRKQHRVTETLLAASIQGRFPGAEAGLLMLNSGYSRAIDLRTRPPQPSFKHLSAFYGADLKRLSFRGEIALFDGRFPAIQQTLRMRSLLPKFHYGVLFYYYHPDFRAFHGRGFGQIGASPENELGYFLNLQLQVSANAALAAYIHSARPVRAWDQAPATRHSRQLQVTHRWGNHRLLLRYSQREQAVPLETGRPALSNEQHHSARLHISSDISPALRLAQRVEIGWSHPPTNPLRRAGFGIYQEVRLKIGRLLTVQARLSQFDTPGYADRLYEFESDLPGSFQNVMLNGRGTKWFLLLKFRFMLHGEVALKYREIAYPDLSELGSGLDLISGNRKRDVRMQLQVSY